MQLILKIKNKRKLRFFTELLNHMDFVEVVELQKLNSGKKKAVEDVVEAVQEAKDRKIGRPRVKSVQQLVEDL
jgi:hypothetical protein